MSLPRVDWPRTLRHYLQVQAFCCVIALITMLIWPANSYLNQLASATITGMLIWLLVEFGRYLIPQRYCHPTRDGGPGWPKGWRGIALAAFGITAGFLIGDPLSDWLLGNGKGSVRDLQMSVLITILAGVAGTFYFHARGKAASLAAEIAAAERDASEARLKLLETQLEPHMLFNTLANLRALITVDPPRAVAMLDRLNSYLRATLAGSRATQHPLAQEFDRLADYLALMAVRMGPRLRYRLDLPDALRELPVPPLLLQPLVENAIRHGLEPKVEGGEIVVSARREPAPWATPGIGGHTGSPACPPTGAHAPASGAARLVLEVADTGVGLPAGGAATGTARPGGGFGVQQVRERLHTLHGARGTMELIADPLGGTRAIATFPL